MRIIKALLNSYYWVKALSYASKENYSKALVILNKCKYQEAEYWAFKAFLEFANKNDDEANIACNEAKALINNYKAKKPHDNKYLNAYITDIEHNLNDSNDHEELSKLLDSISLNNVSSHLKHNFPLISHPNWNIT